MKLTIALMLLSPFLLAHYAHAEECKLSRYPLAELIEQYSTSTGTKFILDPRVMAKVHLVGIDELHIDSATHIGILHVHGYSAFWKGGIVYVVPDVVGRAHPGEYGEPWDG